MSQFLCFYSYESYEDYNKKNNLLKIYDDIDSIEEIEKEDKEKIINLLKDSKEVEKNVLGYFLKKPIKDKKILKKYFDFYSFYYKDIPNDIILENILKIYNKYDNDISELLRDFFNNIHIAETDLGCLNIESNIDKIQIERIHVYSEKDLKELVHKLLKEKEKILDLNFYIEDVLKKVEEDLLLIKKIIKMKEYENCIIIGEIFN